MRTNSREFISPGRSLQEGRTPLLVAIALVLAIGVALCVLYRPWNLLRYGSASPPLPTGELEAPLSERIAQRIGEVRAHPYDASAWGRLGETYDVHDFFPQAILCYERAQRLAPEEPRWPYWLGIAQRLGNQRAALIAFERVIALAPNWASAHFYAGHGYFASERYDDAAREFERALELEHEAPAALIGLAKVALSKKDPKRALEFLERADKGAKTREARWLSAAAWREQGDEAKAQTFAAVNEAPPTQEAFPDALRTQLFWDEGVSLHHVRQRAETLLARGENDKAVRELESYLEKVPRSVDALIGLGDVLMRSGKPEEAIPRYQAACTLDPTQGNALSQWGNALARTGKPTEAIAKLRQALALEPSRVEFKSNLGSVLCSSASPEERNAGLQLLGEAAQARPDDVALRVNLAQALRANGRIDESIAAFQRAIDLAPADARLRFECALLCAKAGRLEDAAAGFAKVLEADKSNLGARMNLVHSLSELGRHREAVAALRVAADLAPGNVEVRSKLAWMLATCPDDGSRSGAEALAIAQELTRSTEEKNAEFMVIRAAAEAETGDLASATKTVEQALDSLKPKTPEVVSDPGLVGIIEEALACRKSFKEGKPYRVGVPK